MSNIYIRPGNDGIVDIPGLNCSSVLYVKGKSFNDAVNELLGAGQLNQEELSELKYLSERINIASLTGDWIVNDANRNATLKTLLDSQTATLVSHASSITTNTANIGTLTTAVGNHTTDIAATTAVANGAASSVASLSGTVSTQGTAITANTNSITANTNAITATNIVVGTNTSTISSQGTTISGHTTQITNMNTTLGTLTTQTGGTNTWQDYDGAVAPENLTSFTGTKVPNISFAVALGNGNLDQNGLFIYKNDSNQNAQIRMETQQAKQMYIRGGSSLLLYAGNNGTVLARNLVRIGAESDHVQIGTLTDAVKFPLITIGSDNNLRSSTNMRGRWYLPTGISIYDGMVRASGIVGIENGLLSTTTSPFFSGLDVLNPLGAITLTAVAGSITLSALVGGIIATTTTGAIQYTTGAGAVSITTGSGAVAITTGAGTVNIASGSGSINQTTISGNIYIGAGKGALGTSGDVQLRSKDKISISPDVTTEIDKTGYMEMADGASAPATTTRKLYHTGGELYYSGSKVSNVKEITAGSNITITSAAGNYTINSTAAGTSTLGQVLTTGNTASTFINMNNNNITNVATIAPAAITGWNVKSLVGGTGISITNSSGTHTISNTTQPTASPNEIATAVGALPSKPFWYSTQYSWLQSSLNLTNTIMNDAWVSNTGQYSLFSGQTRIKYSRDFGVTYAYGNITDKTNFVSVCGTGDGSRIYACNAYEGAGLGNIYFQNTTPSTFGAGFAVTSAAPAAHYSSIRCSQDGRYVIAGTYAGYASVYQSNDFGANFLLRNLAGVAGVGIEGVAISADGRFQFAIYEAGVSGYIHYSSNYGVTWAFATYPSGLGLPNFRKIACSATGQFVSVNIYANGIIVSNDFGQTFTKSTGLTYSTAQCMSANGQFHLSNYQATIQYSEDYGRSFYPAISLSLGGAGASIACSATGGYAICGGEARTYALYDTPTDVRQLIAGANMSVTPNGFGSYTLAASPALPVVQLAYYVGTFVLATGGNTITLPDSIDLDVYSVEIVLEGLLAQSGSSNTFFTIYYNGKFTGRTTWTNQIHGNGEFVAAGDYPQAFTNPVFAYIPQYAGTYAMPAGSIQYFTSVFNVSKHPDTTYSRSPIITNFRTSIGCDSGGSKITSNGAFQYQVGCIQGDTLNGAPNPLPVVNSIVIGQYAAPNGPAASYRSSLSGSPVQILIYLKKKNVA